MVSPTDTRNKRHSMALALEANSDEVSFILGSQYCDFMLQIFM
jgi:hypothetical protein